MSRRPREIWPSLPNLPPCFRVLKELGRGAHGVVVLAEDIRLKSDRFVAIKLLKCSRRTRGWRLVALEREVQVHQTAKHPHIVPVREVFQTEKCVGIVMRHIRGGTLLEFVNRRGPLPEQLARRLFHQLVFAVRHMHNEMHSMHRDIKLENLLVENPDAQLPTLYLCDFSFAKTRGEQEGATVSVVGSTNYFAPEILLRRFRTRYDGMAADIWSCGVCLYVLLYHRYPKLVVTRRGEDSAYEINLSGLEVQLHQQRPTKKSKLKPDDLTPQCLQLLRSLLKADPASRITMDELWNDRWFRVDLPSNW